MASLPVNAFIHPAGRPINTSWLKVLRRPIESASYASQAYRDALATRGITASMSRRGDCWDNAVVESFFATLEWERLDGAPLRTPAGMARALVEFIDGWYNRERMHSSLGYRTPVAFEQELLRTPRAA